MQLKLFFIIACTCALLGSNSIFVGTRSSITTGVNAPLQGAFASEEKNVLVSMQTGNEMINGANAPVSGGKIVTTPNGTLQMMGGDTGEKKGCQHGTGINDIPCQPCNPLAQTDCDEVGPGTYGDTVGKIRGVLTGKQASGPGCLGNSGRTLGQPCVPCDPSKVTPGYGTTCNPGVFSEGKSQMNQTSPVGIKGRLMQGLKDASQSKLTPNSKFFFGALQSLESAKKLPAGFTRDLSIVLAGNSADSAKALLRICNTISAETNVNCNAAPPTQVKPGTGTSAIIACGPFCGALIGWAVAEALNSLFNDDVQKHIDDCNQIGGSWHTVRGSGSGWCEW